MPLFRRLLEFQWIVQLDLPRSSVDWRQELAKDSIWESEIDKQEINQIKWKDRANAQSIVIRGLVLAHIIDKEIMLIHVNLNTRGAPIKF